MSSPPLALEEIDAIIFDFGGVLLPLAYQKTIRGLSELLECDLSHYYSKMTQAAFFDQFETGHIGPAEFRHLLWHSAARDPHDARRRAYYDAHFDRAWNALLLNIPEENLDLLTRLGSRKRTFLLSNTNSIHLESALDQYGKDHPGRGAWEAHFEKAYYSHLIGLRKPDPHVFQSLIDEHRLTAARTLFLDDNAANIAAASSVGLVAVFHPQNEQLPSRFASLQP